MAKSRHWLNECLGEYDLEPGVHKLQATVSWAAALRHEIESWHGSVADEQLAACRRHFATKTIETGPQDKLGQTYCGLFHSLTSATTLVSLDCNDSGRLWMYPTAVVTWYYTHYHAFRAIVLARNQQLGDTHSSLQNSMKDGPSKVLPHPYNMYALFNEKGEHRAALPDAPEAVPCLPVKAFDETGDTAQGILLQYLSTTAKNERQEVEANVLHHHKDIDSFRTKAAKEIRNKRLKKMHVNFMHCAYRYRGKANYRDPLHLSYGTQVRKDYADLIHNLAVSARFAFIVGFAFAERAYGAENSSEFLHDLERNFKGSASATDTELFWRSFSGAALQVA